MSKNELIKPIFFDLGVKSFPAYAEGLDGLCFGLRPFKHLLDQTSLHPLKYRGEEAFPVCGHKIR